MKSLTEAMRAVAYVVAASMDIAGRHADEGVRRERQDFVDLMIPIVKGWCTENSIEIASLGIQIHGGLGFIEETGAAQYLRDSRITTIYEGTTGIQANDLIGRKISRDSGRAMNALISTMRETETALALRTEPEFGAIHHSFSNGLDSLEAAVRHLVENYGTDVAHASVGAVPFLKLCGTVAGGWQLARAALAAVVRIADQNDSGFYLAKITTARFYADHVLPQCEGLAYAVIRGADGALKLTEEQF